MSAGKHRLLEPGALQAGAFFRDLLRASEAQLAAGQRFGVFKLVRELGRGGMGVVWLAERDDGEYRQQVAIKCINDQRSEFAAELFRRERQILAELRHPNIARMLDGGRTDTGQLWFAMELIEGIAIDQHVRLHAAPLDARLRLFGTVLDAVSVAHARLVIHRDIKPGNVLVDADGRAKLLDFGIAALAGDGAAATACTPGWASPEQRAGASVGTASDQYQLGLLLAAMLRREDVRAGAEPWNASAWMAMPQYRRRELQAVLARACAATPEARYQSVAELGREFERMLEQRPISALKGRISYPLACALRRRPGIFAASALGLLLIVALVSAFTWRLARERDISRLQADRAQATRNFLVGLFRDGDPTRGSDPDLSARELIQAGARRVREDQTLPGDARQDLMQLLVDIQLRLGDAENAATLLGELDPAALGAGLLDELQGRLDSVRGRPSAALAHLQNALATGDTPERQLLVARAETDAGEGSAAALRLGRLLAADAALPDALAASAYTSLGVLRWREGKPKDALQAYDQALARIGRAREPVSPVALRINKALAMIDLGRFDDALAEYAQAEHELSRFPNFRHQGLILQNRGMALLRKGDAQAAQTVWLALLALVDEGANPGIEAATVHNLAAAADNLGDPVESIAYSLRAIRLREQLGDAPGALSSRINVAVKLYAVGWPDEGERMAQAAVATAQALSRPDLEARARLAGAMSVCVRDPKQCVRLLDASAAQFAGQDNLVKQLEVLEKLALFTLEQADTVTATRAAQAFAAAIATTSDPALRARLNLLQALATRNADLIAPLASASENARRALVLLALERRDAATARAQAALLPAEISDRYWQLQLRVARANGDSAAAAHALAQAAQLRARVKALLDQSN